MFAALGFDADRPRHPDRRFIMQVLQKVRSGSNLFDENRIGAVLAGELDHLAPKRGIFELLRVRAAPIAPGRAQRLREAHPAGERKVERFGWTFAPCDKVMQIANDYEKEVYNGDLGYINDVDPEAGELVASFDDRSVTYGLASWTRAMCGSIFRAFKFSTKASAS